MINEQLKALLTPIRAMVEKMLPAYRFFQGKTTETKTVELLEDVFANDKEPAVFTVLDPSFAGFIPGQTYTATVNGVSGEYVAAEIDGGGQYIGQNVVWENGPSFDWMVMTAKQNNSLIVAGLASGDYANATIKVSQNRTVTTEHWRVKKLHKDLLPDWVEKQLNAVESLANQAKNAADTAQSTAENKMSANNPTGYGAFSMGRKEGSIVGVYSHAEGRDTKASGNYSHAEGYRTEASGSNSHAECYEATASGNCSHAEGYCTTASGYCSHAEGQSTTASGSNSHAEGYYTKASSQYQHVQGKYNIEDSENKYAHIVGNGTNDSAHSNAHTIDWSGNAWFKGTVEGTAMIVKSTTPGSTKKFKITVDDDGNISVTEVT